jgi:DNA-binding MarR family transcriptional regulator
MTNAIIEERQAILDGMADRWKPNDIRDLARTLLRLADSFDQNWAEPSTNSIFRWPNALSRVERNALNLAMTAKVIYEQRRQRDNYIPPQFFGEPAWDMLLELFMQFSGGAKVSVTSLCIASDAPVSTALRHVAQLEEAGLVRRTASQFDKRVTFVELTTQGIVAVGCYLEKH